MCRAARGLLDMSQADLARAAGVGQSTVRNFEAGRTMPVAQNLAAIVAALEGRGIQFIAAGETAQSKSVGLSADQAPTALLAASKPQ